MASRTFPFTKGFQEKLLGMMVESPEAMSLTAIIQPEYFEFPLHQRLAKIMIRQAQKLKLPPTWSIVRSDVRAKMRAELPKTKELIGRLMQSPLTVAERQYLLTEVGEFCQLQAAGRAIIQSVDLYKAKQTRQLVDLWKETLSIGPGLIDDGVDVLGSAEERHRALMKKAGRPIGTLITPLDKQFLFGGPVAPSLNVAVALPSFGKSYFLIWCSFAAMIQGRKVCHITVDMAADEIGMRFDSCLTGVPIKELRPRWPTVRDRMEILQGRHGSPIWLKGMAPKGTTVDQIDHYLAMLEARGFKTDLLVIDYADKLSSAGGRGGDSRYYELGDVYVELQDLMNRRGLVIWTASQAVRGGYNKTLITMEDIAESFAKVMVADTVITLNQTPDEKATKRARIFIAKNRSSVGFGMIKINTAFDRGRFYTKHSASGKIDPGKALQILNKTGTKTTTQ